MSNIVFLLVPKLVSYRAATNHDLKMAKRKILRDFPDADIHILYYQADSFRPWNGQYWTEEDIDTHMGGGKRYGVTVVHDFMARSGYTARQLEELNETMVFVMDNGYRNDGSIGVKWIKQLFQRCKWVRGTRMLSIG